MPSALREHQYELAPIDGEGLVFGTEDTGYLTLTRPVHGAGESSTNDQNRAAEDGTMFGRDYLGGKTIGFEMGVLTDVSNAALNPGTAAAAYQMNLDYLDAIEGWWRDEEWRRTPRSMAMLRACEAGRVSRAYGRPRRYDEAAGTLTRSGYTPIVCDFQLVDDRWYADEESSMSGLLVSAPSGGITFPFTFPLVATGEGVTDLVAPIGGTRSTWLTVEFHGPVINPSVEVGDLHIGIYGTLAYDEVITIDPRPWVRTAISSITGGSVAGLLDKSTPQMRDMTVEPGNQVIRFRGRDDSGTAGVTLRWRNARSRP